MHKGTWESFNLELGNWIVVFDEAHNVMDSIWEMYKVQMRYEELFVCLKGVSTYLAKYKAWLSDKNSESLSQIEEFLKCILTFLK